MVRAQPTLCKVLVESLCFEHTTKVVQNGRPLAICSLNTRHQNQTYFRRPPPPRAARQLLMLLTPYASLGICGLQSANEGDPPPGHPYTLRIP